MGDTPPYTVGYVSYVNETVKRVYVHVCLCCSCTHTRTHTHRLGSSAHTKAQLTTLLSWSLMRCRRVSEQAAADAQGTPAAKAGES